MKVAVYVEGQSEMLFVADILQKYSCGDSKKYGFICFNLKKDIFSKLNFPQQGDNNSENYYQIVNIGNDNRVISKLNDDIPRLIKLEYDVIIGLKDVFGAAYDMMAKKQIINRDIIKKMHNIQFSSINTLGTDCRLHFAIMECEAWMLALMEPYAISKGYDWAELCERFEFLLSKDPEGEIYHPYPLVREFIGACGGQYNKHGSDVYSFLSCIGKDDYENLRISKKCPSFSKFLDSLFGGECPQLP